MRGGITPDSHHNLFPSRYLICSSCYSIHEEKYERITVVPVSSGRILLYERTAPPSSSTAPPGFPCPTLPLLFWVPKSWFQNCRGGDKSSGTLSHSAGARVLYKMREEGYIGEGFLKGIPSRNKSNKKKYLAR